ncbi:flavin reductase family protein [Rhodotorula paludigena]|uniref:flavin reductase family protein n=1 Tax=Rhodotorula paludigena TaxID=86838 RepID=UPI003176530C
MASRHPPFKQVEASRPPFDPTETWQYSQTPAPDWVVGTGASGREDLPGVKEGSWTSDEGRVREIDPKTTGALNLYKMMISAITPRPIGFISTLNKAGEGNLAPFSYFNIACHDPPTVVVSFTHPNGDELKGTCENILDTKEFVANIISEPFIEAANYTSIDAPKGVSEWPLSGLTPVQSKTVKPPRVGESGFSMECELEHHYHLYNDAGARTGTVVLGRVRLFLAREDLVDPETFIVDTGKLMPVSRLGGITYARTTRAYELPRPVYAAEKEKDEVKKAQAKV